MELTVVERSHSILHNSSQLRLAHKNLVIQFRYGGEEGYLHMKQIMDLSSQLFLSCFVSSFSLLLIQGLAQTTTSNTSNTTKDEKSSGSSTWVKALLVCLGLVAIGSFSVFLFKLWQRKKREEQHARLLRLFEQDDELEVELGIRD